MPVSLWRRSSVRRGARRSPMTSVMQLRKRGCGYWRARSPTLPGASCPAWPVRSWQPFWQIARLIKRISALVSAQQLAPPNAGRSACISADRTHFRERPSAPSLARHRGSSPGSGRHPDADGERDDLPSGNRGPEAEVVAKVSDLLTLAVNDNATRMGGDCSSMALVAGTGFEPVTFRL